MDIATIVGLLGAFGLIFSAIDDIGAFIDVPSLLIVVAGSSMVTMCPVVPRGFYKRRRRRWQVLHVQDGHHAGSY